MAMLSSAPVIPTIPVVDLKRAQKFYEQKLGLTQDRAVGPDHVVYKCGEGTSLLLYQRGHSKADHTLAGFGVRDLAAQMQELRDKGVVFEEYDFPGLKTVNGVATVGLTKSAWFKDSEGNILGLTELV